MLTQNKNMSWLSSLFLAGPLRQQYFNFPSRQKQDCTSIHFPYQHKNPLTGSIPNSDPVINRLGFYLSDNPLTGTTPKLSTFSLSTLSNLSSKPLFSPPG